MAAQVIPLFGNEALCDAQEDWKARCLSFISMLLEELPKALCMDKLSDITSSLSSHKADILGQMALAFIRIRHGALLEQEHCHCPECDRVLKRRGKHKGCIPLFHLPPMISGTYEHSESGFGVDDNLQGAITDWNHYVGQFRK